MDLFSAGLTAAGTASSLLGGLFGSQNNSNQNFSWYSMAQSLVDQQANDLRRKQMNLDAQRRKRDIIRQAQVATANAENAAANGGALNSSGIVGATSEISGQAGVNYLGVDQNQRIGNMMFNLENQRILTGMTAGYQKASQRANFWDALGGAGAALNGRNIEAASKIGQWGLGVISNI